MCVGSNTAALLNPTVNALGRRAHADSPKRQPKRRAQIHGQRFHCRSELSTLMGQRADQLFGTHFDQPQPPDLCQEPSRGWTTMPVLEVQPARGAAKIVVKTVRSNTMRHATDVFSPKDPL